MAFLSWRSVDGSISPVSIPTKTLPIGRNERRGEKFKDILLFRGNAGEKGEGVGDTGMGEREDNENEAERSES